MSNKLSNAAMCKRLATVGKTLEDSSRATVRQRIDAWLDPNDECHDKLLKMMEAGLVHELVTGKQEANLPRSCTKPNLVEDHVLTRSLGKSNPALTFTVLRELKKNDAKAKEKLRLFALGLEPNFAMRGHLSLADWNLSWSHRCEIFGNRLGNLVIKDGHVNWQAGGCYSWALPAATAQGGNQWRFLGQEDIQSATHIVHVASKVGIALERLEIPKVDTRWVIQNNWNEKEATISNGGRFFVHLWPDFQGEAFFDYTRRLEAKYPDSPFLSNFGKGAADETKADRRAAQDAAAAAVEASKKAGFADITQAMVPAKKRRRLTIGTRGSLSRMRTGYLLGSASFGLMCFVHRLMRLGLPRAGVLIVLSAQGQIRRVLQGRVHRCKPLHLRQFSLPPICFR